MKGIVLAAIAAVFLAASPALAGDPSMPSDNFAASSQLENCHQFALVPNPNTPSNTVDQIYGYSEDTEDIEVFDTSASAPPNGATPVAFGVLTVPGMWQINLPPSGMRVHNGLLVCNSTNSSPLAYTAGTADTAFAIFWH